MHVLKLDNTSLFHNKATLISKTIYFDGSLIHNNSGHTYYEVTKIPLIYNIPTKILFTHSFFPHVILISLSLLENQLPPLLYFNTTASILFSSTAAASPSPPLICFSAVAAPLLLHRCFSSSSPSPRSSPPPPPPRSSPSYRRHAIVLLRRRLTHFVLCRAVSFIATLHRSRFLIHHKSPSLHRKIWLFISRSGDLLLESSTKIDSSLEDF